MYNVVVISGDGIGPEITEAAEQVLEATGVPFAWHRHPAGLEAISRFGTSLPWSTLEAIRRYGLALKGPLIAERCTGGVTVEAPEGVRRHASINNGLRRELKLFVNVRPVRGWPIVSGIHQSMDVVVMREITEDLYSGLERQVDDDRFEATKVTTVSASRRVAEFACQYALRHGRRTIHAIHKANVLHKTDGTFLNAVREVTAQYPELRFDETAIDAACYLAVKYPKRFDVMVASNQYGDILSDLLAGLAGSLGLAPGSNIGEQVAVFEAAHGAAPDIAGQNKANPGSLILSGAMLLDHIGEYAAAARIRTALASLFQRGRCLTPDLGGSAGTREFTAALCSVMQDVSDAA